MIRLPEAGFEARVKRVDAATSEMWRMSRSLSTEPYFSDKGDHRFDDPDGKAGAATFGVLYVGQDPETAFCESIVHETSLFRNGAYEVAQSELTGRELVGFKHPTKDDLTLADLTGDALKALGLNNDISAGGDYDLTQQWARAIHDKLPDVDGIRYVSRQRNDCYCYAVFDRSGIVVDDWTALDPGDLAVLCDQFNVRVVTPGP